MTDLNDMTLEKFKLWSTNALRVYLSLRNKLISGNFDELSARAFCAWEQNIAVDTNAEHQQRLLLTEYHDKLKFEDEYVPDPCSIKTGWCGEANAMSKWPSVYITDISAYLKNKNSDDLMKRLLNEYKEGKAYRYFTGEWVKEICYHDVHEKSDKCILKAKVTPSQCVNNKPYNIWIIVKKDKESVPGGEVLSAYCSCTAGMLGSCNHIAGVLFRVEHAVKTGLTKQASTSKPCVWNIPKCKTSIKHGKASEMVWKKSRYTKIVNVEKEKQKSLKRTQFTPLNKKQEKEFSKESLRMDLYNSLKDEVPDSCFCLLVEKRTISMNENKPALPPSLIKVAQSIDTDGKTTEERETEFLKEIQLTEAQILSLNISTTDQAQNEIWKENRCGRITASAFHRVYCRSKTLKKKPEEDPTSVVSLVMGSSQNIQTQAMKHGISLEPDAKVAYVDAMKSQHKHLKTKASGIVVSKDKPYISASPDLLVECKCCGAGLCEIKCPESIKDQSPSVENVPYIYVGKDGKITLKKMHPYFYQIQGQMGLTSRSYCDLFIFTFHGHICVRIMFDNDFFIDMMDNISWFWKKFALPELLKLHKPKHVLMDKDMNK